MGTRPKFQLFTLKSSICNPDDFCAKISAVHRKPADRHRQFEAPRACAAGIEIQHAISRLLLRNVAVAGDHDSESRHLRLQIELRQIVQHEDGNAAEFDDFRLRQSARPHVFVDVAADRAHRRNGCQVLKNLGRADVSRVNNVLRALQSGERFRAKQSVSIGDDADEDGSLNSQGLAFDLNS